MTSTTMTMHLILSESGQDYSTMGIKDADPGTEGSWYLPKRLDPGERGTKPTYPFHDSKRQPTRRVQVLQRSPNLEGGGGGPTLTLAPQLFWPYASPRLVFILGRPKADKKPVGNSGIDLWLFILTHTLSLSLCVSPFPEYEPNEGVGAGQDEGCLI